MRDALWTAAARPICGPRWVHRSEPWTPMESIGLLGSETPEIGDAALPLFFFWN